MGLVHVKWFVCDNCCCCCYCCCSSSSDGSVGVSGNAAEVGPLQEHVSAETMEGNAAVPSHGFYLTYFSLSQRGHYPDDPDRENQDAICIRTNLQGNPNLHFFGVFDGHGNFGAKCANFVRDELVDLLSSDTQLVEDPAKAYNSAFLAVNHRLRESEIDDSLSGTTAITVLISGDTLTVANVGDSRAVAAVVKGDVLVAEDLSHDQTPFRKDEYERVKLCGARVLSIDQVEGIKDPEIQSWEEGNDEGDPPRLWLPDAICPGTAFTRSVGDSVAESVGVIAVPEVLTVKMTPNHRFFVIASDGVFEFLSSQTVVDMVASFKDPRDASSAIAAKSYELWLEQENRTDDITIIIVHIRDLSIAGPEACSETTQTRMQTLAKPMNSTDERSMPSGSSPHRHQETLSEHPLVPQAACVAPQAHPMSLEMVPIVTYTTETSHFLFTWLMFFWISM